MLVLGLVIGLVAGFVLGAWIVPFVRSFRAVVDIRDAEEETEELPPIERRVQQDDGPPRPGRTWT